MKLIKTKALLLAAVAGSGLFALGSANAQNANHAPSDLVLTFQNPGGTQGSTSTVIAALGNVSTVFRDAGTFTSINIGTQLGAAFGASWFDQTTLWMGAVGFRGTSASVTTTLDGDPHQTIYFTKVRSGVGTVGLANSAAPSVGANTGTGITSGMNQVKNQFETVGTTNPFTQATSASFIDENNPFTVPGVQSAAYSNIAGGVQGNFGAGTFGTYGSAGVVELAMDLYRIQTRSDVADPTGFNQTNDGQYLGTITINNGGAVGYIAAVPEPSTTVLVGLGAAFSLFVMRRRRALPVTCQSNP